MQLQPRKVLAHFSGAVISEAKAMTMNHICAAQMLIDCRVCCFVLLCCHPQRLGASLDWWPSSGSAAGLCPMYVLCTCVLRRVTIARSSIYSVTTLEVLCDALRSCRYNCGHVLQHCVATTAAPCWVVALAHSSAGTFESVFQFMPIGLLTRLSHSTIGVVAKSQLLWAAAV